VNLHNLSDPLTLDKRKADVFMNSSIGSPHERLVAMARYFREKSKVVDPTLKASYLKEAEEYSLLARIY